MSLHQKTHPTNNFDFIRIVAASMVLFSHHFALTGNSETSFFGLYSLGGLAVAIFFIISGYLVTISWYRDPHLLRFAYRRFLRIWPALTCVVVLAALVLGPSISSLPLGSYLTHGATWDYLRTLYLQVHYVLPGVFAHNPYPAGVNGSLWTIPFEVRCYIALGVAGLLGLLKSRAVFLLCIGAYFTWFLVKSNADVTGSMHYGRELSAFFLAGAAMAVLEPHWRRQPLAWYLACGVSFAALWFVGWRHTAMLVGLPLLVIHVGTLCTPVVHRAGRFGDPSYGIYLFAFPVQQLVISRLWPEADFWGTLTAAAIITLMLAYASWHLIEKQALKMKPSSGREPLLPKIIQFLRSVEATNSVMLFKRIIASPYITLVVAALLLVIGALLRFHHLGDFSFWDDELFSVSNVLRAGPWNGPLLPERGMAHLEISDSFWTWKLADPHPPLYEMLLVPWIAVWGSSEFAVRSLSAIFGILTMLSALALPRTIISRVRLTYMLLLATSGCLLIYSQEARNYSLCACLSAWMLTCLLRDMEHAPERLKEGRVSIPLLILGGLLAFSHYYGLVFVCSIAFYLLTQVRSLRAFVRLSLLWLAALACTFIYIGLGWVGIMTKLNAAPPDPLSFAMAFKRNILGLLRNFSPSAVGTSAFWMVMLLLIVGGFAYMHRRPLPPLRSFIIMLAGVLALFFLVQVFGTRRADFIHERYMIFMVPGCLLLLALFTQHPGWPKFAAGLLVLASIPSGLQVWQKSPKPMGYGDWRGGAALVSNIYRPGDIIIVPMDQPVMMSYFQHYLKDHIPAKDLERDMLGGQPIPTLVAKVRAQENLPRSIIIFTHYAFKHTTSEVLQLLKTELRCTPGPLQSAQIIQVIEVTCDKSKSPPP